MGAAIILKDNKILIAQRAPGENLAGKWEFPGGKIEPGETPQECLKREISEEFDVDIEVLDYFGAGCYSILVFIAFVLVIDEERSDYSAKRPRLAFTSNCILTQ
ncbi:MAG: (deoxy)nucleoside triphosphate pyrophosphohydrolase [Desulfitobacteriaceae bacterium]